jgi:hypothetical protein
LPTAWTISFRLPIKWPPCTTKKSKDATACLGFYRSVLDGGVRKKVGLLNRRIAKFSAINLEGEIEPAKVEAYAPKKSDLQEVITLLNKEIDERKATHWHMRIKILQRTPASIA